jgi:Flp pilus assembly protein TadB
MQNKKNKINFIHGSIAILIGLGIIIWGPIGFRGFSVNSSVGFLICLFGLVVILVEILKNKRINKNIKNMND